MFGSGIDDFICDLEVKFGDLGECCSEKGEDDDVFWVPVVEHFDGEGRESWVLVSLQSFSEEDCVEGYFLVDIGLFCCFSIDAVGFLYDDLIAVSVESE